MKNELTQKQKNALGRQGPITEIEVEKWLRKKGYTIDDSHKGKKSNLPYDILATKGKARWVIDVKSGEKPLVKIENIRRMIYETHGYNKIGLAFVGEDYIYLFEFRKWSKYGHDAAETKKWRNAGKNPGKLDEKGANELSADLEFVAHPEGISITRAHACKGTKIETRACLP
jgi:Holliday junction resolvase